MCRRTFASACETEAFWREQGHHVLLVKFAVAHCHRRRNGQALKVADHAGERPHAGEIHRSRAQRDYEIQLRMKTKAALEGILAQGEPVIIRSGRLDKYGRTLARIEVNHPEAPLLANDRSQKAWVKATRYKAIAKIKNAAGLRTELQFQDFRRTAMTEAR